MKTISIIIMFLSLVTGNSFAGEQNKVTKRQRQQEQSEKIQRLVEANDYTFVAQRAVPMGGNSIHLSSNYDLKVGNDAIAAYLPFYGRAYSAPMNNTEGGIRFESMDFDYKIEPAKKDGWDAHITARDGIKRYDMILRITSSGSAFLTVIENTRQNITFNGYIEERKK